MGVLYVNVLEFFDKILSNPLVSNTNKTGESH